MNSIRPRLVLFDCDGTLVDSQHVIVTCMTSAFTEHGIEAPRREQILDIVGLSLPEAFERLLHGTGLRGVAALAESYKAHFRQYRASGPVEPLYPGALDAVLTLAGRREVLLGVATGKSRRGVDAVLGHHDLLKHFVTIQTADDAPSKPHPGMVIQAMSATGVEPKDTVVVGDTTFDMAMARSAGAGAIGVGWGYHPAASLPGAGAETVLVSFDELLPLLDRRWRETAA
ncbi:HAD-IA family hydrolase [Microbaculum marinum]|uniref:HAD-IA family hydrolase n=1 Tax=Microbaculum marinum TaxID=1764581 RepID=A0AAW9S0M2_9HYPH